MREKIERRIGELVGALPGFEHNHPEVRDLYLRELEALTELLKQYPKEEGGAQEKSGAAYNRAWSGSGTTVYQSCRCSCCGNRPRDLP